jgi:alpha-beta hydrolase superfamily lysophospholipase
VDSSEGTFRSASGKNIFYRCWEPPAPRAVILLAHGLAEHSGRYREFAEFFADGGFATWALDHPGHGRSEGKRGHVDRFEEYTEALGQLLSVARQAHPNVPCVLLGHSMGGLIAADFLLLHQDAFVAAVLSGAAIQSPQQPSRIALFLNKLIAMVLPRFGVMRMDASGISKDPQVVSNYENDPLVYRGKVTAGLANAIFSAMNRVVADAASIRLPLLIMHGSIDNLTAVDGSKLLHGLVSSEDKKIVIYDGLYHEILNEPERG